MEKNINTSLAGLIAALAIIGFGLPAFSSEDTPALLSKAACVNSHLGDLSWLLQNQKSEGGSCQITEDPVSRWLGLNLDLSQPANSEYDHEDSRNLASDTHMQGACEFHPPMVTPICS
jgi:hypothetical protein